MTTRYQLVGSSGIFLLVFFFAPVNDLLISYNQPNIPIFDFYTLIFAVFIVLTYLSNSSNFHLSFEIFLLITLFVFVIAITFATPPILDSAGHSTITVNLYFVRKAISYLVLGWFVSAHFSTGLPNRSAFYLLTIIFFFLIDWQILRLNTLDYPNRDNWGNYHFLSESYAICSFMLACALKGRKAQLLLCTSVSLIILFCLGSRSSFFCYLAAISLFFILSNMFRAYLILLLAVMLASLIFYDYLFEFLGLPQLFRFFSGNITQDGSFVGRRELLYLGLTDIRNNWFTGYLGGQINHDYDLWGGYIHDFRSYWRQFGIVPFASYSLLIFTLNAKIVFCAVKHPNTQNIFAAVSLVFFTLESVLARSYLSTYIYFFVGFVLHTLRQRKKYDTEDHSLLLVRPQ